MQRLPGLFLLAGRGFCFSQSLAGNETDHELLPITGVNCGLLNEMMDPHTHKVLNQTTSEAGHSSSLLLPPEFLKSRRDFWLLVDGRETVQPRAVVLKMTAYIGY